MESYPGYLTFNREKMRLLIAYDGSDCAQAALDELLRAGLPREAEAIVISVADVWLAPESDQGEAVRPVPLAVQKARAQARQALEEARALAEGARVHLQANFTKWQVSAEAVADSPAWAVIKKASQWPADLVVVGSHGRSALSRFILGSVSQKVVTEAPCSVRVARARSEASDGGVRIIVGVDGSPDAEAAVHMVAARVWPSGSEIRLITAVDPRLSTELASPHSQIKEWADERDEEAQAWVSRMVAAAAEKLKPTGAAISHLIKKGDPRGILLDEAEAWKADCIFVGARGLGFLERFLIGSVSAAVAARAHCSVEIVRPRPTA
jgi:nucleotide-binding universal stress UspA family protein